MEIDVNEIKANIASGNYEELKQMKISDRVSNTVIVDLMVAENKEAIIGLYKTKVEPLYSKINEKLLPYFERGKIENLTFENSGREPIFNSLMEDPITGNNVKVDLKLDIIFTKDGYTLENIVGREGNIDIEKLADRVQEVLGRDDILISRETVE